MQDLTLKPLTLKPLTLKPRDPKTALKPRPLKPLLKPLKPRNEVPVLFINGRKAFKYRVTEAELKKGLRRKRL